MSKPTVNGIVIRSLGSGNSPPCDAYTRVSASTPSFTLSEVDLSSSHQKFSTSDPLENHFTAGLCARAQSLLEHILLVLPRSSKQDPVGVLSQPAFPIHPSGPSRAFGLDSAMGSFSDWCRRDTEVETPISQIGSADVCLVNTHVVH